MESLAEAYSLVQNLNESELIAELERLSSQLQSEKTIIHYSLFLDRFARINPEGAMAYIDGSGLPIDTKRTMRGTAVSSWAKNDPLMAFNWEMNRINNNTSNKNTSYVSNHLTAVFSHLAMRDLNEAFDKISELGDENELVNSALNGIANSLSEASDYIQFYNNTRTMNSEAPMRNIVNRWAREDPREVADWLDTIEGDDNKARMQIKVFNAWMEKEPEISADWYMSIASDQNRQSHVHKIVKKWGRTSAQDAFNWIEKQSNLDSEQSMYSLLQSASYSNVDFAIEKLDRLYNEKKKQAVSANIYFSLKRNDSERAENFLNQSVYKELILEKEQERQKRNKRRGR